MATACASTHHATAGAMMGSGSGYQLSGLRCAGPSAPAGQAVGVTLADMGMSRRMGGTAPMGSHMMLRVSTSSVPAGLVTIVAGNMGWRTHELVILPLSPGVSDGQRVPGSDGKVSEVGSLGEASRSCAGGAGDGITAGSVGWVSLHLAAGRYELLCNLKNHYADGMHQVLVVT